MKRLLWLVIAALLVVAGCSDDDETVGEAATTPTQPSPSEPTLAPTGFGLAMSCLPMDPAGWSDSADLVGRIDDAQLAASDTAVVALGSGHDDSNAVSQYSSDGLNWIPSDGLPELSYWGPTVAVAGGPRGFVAVGTANGELPNTPVVAFSADGSSWEQIDLDALPDAEVSWITDVFAGPEGFLIIGRASSSHFVWSTDDGRTWNDSDLPVREWEGAAVANTDAGWVILTAQDAFDEPKVQVWTSPDGLAWSEAEAETLPPRAALLSYSGTTPLSVIDDTWVLALAGATDDYPGPRSPTVWASTDNGVSWTEHTVWDEPGQPGFQTYDSAATDFGLLLTGYQDRQGENGESFAHHSEDGVDWRHCWTSPHELTSIVSFGNAIVAHDSGSGHVRVWNQP